MRTSVQLIVGCTLASAFGIAVAQMTPALPNPPASQSPATRTDTTTTSPDGTTTQTTTFVSLDADKSGSVSKQEASTNKALTLKWDTLDANKDGMLDQAEFAQFETSTTKTKTKVDDDGDVTIKSKTTTKKY